MTDHAALGRRPDWVPDAVFYQIFPDRFRNGDPDNDPPGVKPWGSPPSRTNFMGGDLAGIREGIPYLEELGISALYLTPIFDAASNHRYDTRDYLRVDPALGDETELAGMVAAAHAAGIRILLDGVFNHCGEQFRPFRDLMEKGAESRYANWFFPHAFPIQQDPPNYQTCGGAGFLPKLNTADPELRAYLLNVATHWIEVAAIDGWRLDVPWKAERSFWAAFREAVKTRLPDAYLVAEIWRDARPWQALFDGVMNYPLRDYLLAFCADDTMDAEDFRFETDALFASPFAPWQLNLIGSHDTPRLLTLCRGDALRAMLALTAMFVAPGAPMIYYGDEIGMTGENDPGCRGCMVWDRATWNRSLFAHCRHLITLRRCLPALRRGTWEPQFAFNGLLVVLRRHADGDVLIVLNPRDARSDFEVPIAIADGCWEDRLSGEWHAVARGRLRLPRIDERAAMILTPAVTR
jgi:cyclomaltodextrinase